MVVGTGEGCAIDFEKQLHRETGRALVAILKGMVLGEPKSKVCSLQGKVYVLVEGVIARARERRLSVLALSRALAAT